MLLRIATNYYDNSTTQAETRKKEREIERIMSCSVHVCEYERKLVKNTLSTREY